MIKILIVDANPSIGGLLHEELTDEGYFVFRACASKSLTESIQSLKPDLVLLEPYIHGTFDWYPLMEIKRASPLTPIVVFTAYSGFPVSPSILPFSSKVEVKGGDGKREFRYDPDGDSLFEMNGWVTKSSDLNKLKETIARVVRERHSIEGAHPEGFAEDETGDGMSSYPRAGSSPLCEKEIDPFIVQEGPEGEGSHCPSIGPSRCAFKWRER